MRACNLVLIFDQLPPDEATKRYPASRRWTSGWKESTIWVIVTVCNDNQHLCLILPPQPVASSSDSDTGGTPFATEHAPSDSPKSIRNELNSVTMATGIIPWEDSCLQNVGFVTGKHGRKSQSPVISPGKIGKKSLKENCSFCHEWRGIIPVRGPYC